MLLGQGGRGRQIGIDESGRFFERVNQGRPGDRGGLPVPFDLNSNPRREWTDRRSDERLRASGAADVRFQSLARHHHPYKCIPVAAAEGNQRIYYKSCSVHLIFVVGDRILRPSLHLFSPKYRENIVEQHRRDGSSRFLPVPANRNADA